MSPVQIVTIGLLALMALIVLVAWLLAVLDLYRRRP